MPTQDISIVVRILDEASKVAKQIQGSLEDMKPVFKDMAIVGTAAFTGITAGLVMSVNAASKAQTEMAKFNATMATMGKAGEEAKKQLLETAEATIQLGFDDEDTANSLAKFYQRTGNVKDAQTLLNVTLDLARAKNLDLESATKLVNMALSGSGRALMQYGIAIKDTASPMEALSILQQKVGGQAIAFSETFAGKMAIMNVQITNVKKVIGNAFLPILIKLLAKIQPVVDRILEWIKKNPELTRNIILAGLAISGLVAVVGTLGLILPAIIGGFSALAGPIGLVLIVIGGLVWYVSSLHIDWGLLLEKIKEIDPITIAKNVFNNLSIAVGWVWERIQDLIEIAGELYGYFTTNILPVLTALWNMAIDFLAPAFERLWDTLSTRLWPALQNLWKTISTQLLPSLLQFWNAIQPLVIILGAALYGALVLVVDIIIKLIDFIAKVLTVITDLTNFLIKVAVGAINVFVNGLNAIVDAFKSIYEWGQKAAQFIGSGISAVGKGVSSLFGSRQEGGAIYQTGPYLLHQGEYVVPKTGALVGAGIGGMNITITGNTFMSDREAAQKIGDMIIETLKNNLRI